MSIKVKKLHPDAVIPKYETEGAAGFDIRAIENFTIQGQSRGTVSTGLAFEIPDGFEIQIRSRSGLASKSGISVLNSPGTIDSSYRGEIKIILQNHDKSNFSIKKGDRIAQGVLKQVPIAIFEEVEELSTTERGEGGLGSTGIN